MRYSRVCVLHDTVAYEPLSIRSGASGAGCASRQPHRSHRARSESCRGTGIVGDWHRHLGWCAQKKTVRAWRTFACFRIRKNFSKLQAPKKQPPAGSSVLLLSLTWGGSLLLGRCDLNEQGMAVNKTLTKGFDPVNTGVTTDSGVKNGALVMALSALLYGSVQIPAFLGDTEDPLAALVGALACFATAIGYCVYQVGSCAMSSPNKWCGA